MFHVLCVFFAIWLKISSNGYNQEIKIILYILFSINLSWYFMEFIMIIHGTSSYSFHILIFATLHNYSVFKSTCTV